MNIVRTLILSALGVGAMALATPSHADERTIVKERTYISDERPHYRHHHHDWEREHRGRVVIRDTDDASVSVAFGGHPHPRYHHYHHDWDR